MAHPPDTGPEDRGPRLPAGLQACQLALSTRTVWARCPNGELARRYGVTDKNPAGDYWKRIPGTAMCLTGRFWAHRAAPAGLALPQGSLSWGPPGRGQGAGPPALKLRTLRHRWGWCVRAPQLGRATSGRGAE